MDISVLGIDLGKTVCSLTGLDAKGEVVFRKRVQRCRQRWLGLVRRCSIPLASQIMSNRICREYVVFRL